MREIAERLAGIISDYREGRVAGLGAAHVLRWVEQFPESVRAPLLTEVAHVLSRTYASKQVVRQFLQDTVTNAAIVGDDPTSFWRSTRLLRLQRSGSSQGDLLNLFDEVLQAVLGLGLADCGEEPLTFVYLDDGV